MSHVALTGAGGFLGWHTRAALVEATWPVPGSNAAAPMIATGLSGADSAPVTVALALGLAATGAVTVAALPDPPPDSLGSPHRPRTASRTTKPATIASASQTGDVAMSHTKTVLRVMGA